MPRALIHLGLNQNFRTQFSLKKTSVRYEQRDYKSELYLNTITLIRAASNDVSAGVIWMNTTELEWIIYQTDI